MLHVEVRAKELPRGGSRVGVEGSTDIVKLLAYPVDRGGSKGVRLVVNPHRRPGQPPTFDMSFEGDWDSMTRLRDALVAALAYKEYQD